LVGGRVDVTKRAGAFVGAFSGETVKQAVSMNAKMSSVKIFFLFIDL
jgi:hypothetical protein